MTISPKPLLQLLVQAQVLTSQQADEYELDALRSSVPIDTYLIDRAKVDRQSVLKAIAALTFAL